MESFFKKKKKTSFLPWHVHFNLIICLLSGLTPQSNHLEILVQVQGVHHPPSAMLSWRFTHVQPPECNLFVGVAPGSF